MQFGYAVQLNQIALTVIACGSLILAACGGSGTSDQQTSGTAAPPATSNPPPTPPPPSVSIDDAGPQTYSALYLQMGSLVTVTLNPTFTFANFSGTPQVKVTAPTTGGVLAETFSMSDATHGRIAYMFASPGTLVRNTYSTPVTVTVCVDVSCNTPVQTFTLTVNYDITNSLTLNGNTVSAFPLAAQLIASNPNSNNI